MRVNAGDVIAGQEAGRLRALFRHVLDHGFTCGFVTERLGLSPEEGLTAMARLHEEGWILEDGDREEGWHRLTTKGRSLALASFSPPMKRSTAERKIEEFLERVRVVNLDPYYLYAVERVLLFGSMLGKSDRVGDVDLIIDLESRIEDPERRTAEEMARRQYALECGRRFSNYSEVLSWPRDEVFLFLKSGSRGLSFHDSDDLALGGIRTSQLCP